MPEIVTRGGPSGTSRQPQIIPVTQAPNPDLRYFYDEGYDVGYRPGMNQEYVRSGNQSWYGQLGQGLMSRGLSIAPKVIGGFGSVGMALAVPFTDYTLDDIWNNSLSTWASQWDESLNEVFPVYKSQKYAEGQLLEKMMTTSFWATDGMDGLAFAASAYVPGRALGAGLQALKSAEFGTKVAKGLKALVGPLDESLVSAAKTFGKLEGGTPVRTLADPGLQAIDNALQTYIATPTAKAALALREAIAAPLKLAAEATASISPHQANLVLSTAYNTVAEAAAEAYQTQKEVESIYLSRGFEPEQAKLKAAEAAKETFGANAAVLAIPNFIQNSMFHGAWAAKTKAARQAAIESEGAAVAQNFVEDRWKQVTKGFVSEGLWEENAQTSIQQYERAFAKGFSDHSFMREVTENLFSNMKGFAKSVLPGEYQLNSDEIEGSVAIALGGLLGSGFGFMSHKMETANAQELIKNENEAVKSFINDVIPTAQKVMRENVTSILKTNGTTKVQQGDKEVEVPNYIIDENGNYQVNEEAVVQLTLNSLKDLDFWSLDLVAAMNNNQTIGEYNKEIALASFAYQLATKRGAYTKDDIRQLLEKATKTGDAEAKRLGLDTQIKENMDTVNRYLDLIEDLNNSYQTAKAVSDPNEFQFRKFLLNTDLYLKAKLAAVERIRANHKNLTPEIAEQLDNIVKDTLEHQNFLNNSKDKMRKIHDALIDTPQKYLKEIKAINDKKDKTQEDYNSLRALDFLFQEHEYIYGTFYRNVTGTYNNPIGINTADMVKTSRGSLDMKYLATGKSWLAARASAQALNKDPQSPEDWLAAESEFLKISVNTDPDLVSELSTKLVNGLVEAAQAGLQELQAIEKFEGAAAEVESIFELEDDATSDIFSAETLEILGLEPGVPLTEEDLMAAQDQIAAVLPELAKRKEEVNKALINLQTKIDRIQNYQDRFDSNTSKFIELENAEDKDSFLKKEFFEAEIKRPIESFIEYARANKDTIDHLSKAEQYISLLKNLLAAYEIRTDAAPESVVKDAERLLNIMETEILEYISKNLNNRTALQIETNNILGVNLLNTLKENEELRQLVKTILGTDLPKESELSENGVISLDAINVLFYNIRSKATPEQLNQLSLILDKLSDNLATSLYNLIPQGRKKLDFHIKNALTQSRRVYLELPNSQIINIIKWVFEKEFTDPDIKAYERLHKFSKDGDILSLQLGLSTITQLNDVDRLLLSNIVEKHQRLLAIKELSSAIVSSDLDVPSLVDLKSKLNLDQNPSLQQNIIITQALNFLFSKNKSGEYGNWFLANGVGGSGKTFVVGNLVPQLWASLSKKSLEDSAIAFSRTKFTSSNINRSVFGREKDTTFESFLNLSDEQLSKLTIVIIDEAYTFSNEEIFQIKEKLKGTNIKVIALGDYSQISAEEDHNLMNNFSPGLTIAPTLTATFRTNVDSITNFANTFRLKVTPVSQTFVTANQSLEETLREPSKAAGVLSTSEEDILTALRQPSSRSRVLIVPTPQDRANYQSVLGNVTVITPEESQGYQWDEVYAILNPAIYPDPFTANQYIYTVLSRARNLLIVSGLDVANTAPRTEASIQLSQQDNILEDNKRLFNSSVSAAQKYLQTFTGTPIVTKEELRETTAPEIIPTEEPDETPVPVAPEDEEILSSVIEDIQSEAEEVVLPPSTPMETGNSHSLRYPTNANLAPIVVNNQLVSPIRLGSTGHIIKVNARDKVYYHVIAPVVTGGWTSLGILGDEDFKANPQLGSLITKDISGIPLAALGTSKVFPLSLTDISNSSVGEISILNTTRFKTNFASSFHTEGSNGRDIIEETIYSFYRTFYGVDESGQRRYPAEVYDNDGVPKFFDKDWFHKNGKPNWNVLKDKIEVRLMTKKYRTEIAKFNPEFATVIEGAPYLVIKDAKQKGSPTTKFVKSYYIQLQPQQLSEDALELEPIRKVASAIEGIETILGSKYNLGTKLLEETVHQYALSNFVLDAKLSRLNSGNVERSIKRKQEFTPITTILGIDTTQEIAEQLDTLFTEVVQLIYGVDKKILTFNSVKEAEEFLAANAAKNEDGTWTLQSEDISQDTGLPKTYRITSIETYGNKGKAKLRYAPSLENPDKTLDYESYGIVKGKGPAQHRLNALAMANRHVSGLPIRITSVQTAGGAQVKFTRSKSILSSSTALDLNGFLNDPRVVESGWTSSMFDKTLGTLHITQAYQYLEEKFGEEEANKIIKQYTIDPFRLIVLQAIVHSEQFVNGKHVSLRTPLHLHKFDWTGVNDIGTSDNKAEYRLHVKEFRDLIASKLSSSFAGLTRTSVLIGLPTTEIPAIKVFGDSTGRDVLNIFPPKLGSASSEVIKFLKTIPSILNTKIFYQEAVDYGGERHPLYEIKGTIKLPGAATIVDPAYPNGVAIFSALTEEDIKQDRFKATSIMLHELLHAATMPAILKGQKDISNGVESKEALLVQRLNVLKEIFEEEMHKRKIPPVAVYQNTRGEVDIYEFVANLSNENFRKHAVQVKVESSNILLDILRALLDFFKGKSNVYDLTLQSLVDFYNEIDTTTVVVTEDLGPQLSQVKNKLDLLIDKFQEPDKLKEYLRGIYDLRDLSKKNLSNIFNKKPISEQINILTKAYNGILSDNGNIKFAIYNRPKDTLITLKGGVLNTAFLLDAIKDKFKESWNEITENQQNFIYTVLHRQLISAGDRVLEDLVYFRNNDRLSLVALFWNEYLSNTDKRNFSELYNTTTDQEAIELLESTYDENPFTQILDTTIQLIELNRTEIEEIVGTLQDRTPYIYKEAKNFITELIGKNQGLRDSDTEIMKTRYSLYLDILESVRAVNIQPQIDLLTSYYEEFSKLANSSTHNDRYFNLLYTLIPNLENRVMALLSLQSKSERSGLNLATEIYRELYPKDPLEKIESMEIAMEIAELEQVEVGDIDEDIKEAVNISEYIIENNKSPELTLSESMKDFLLTASIAGSKGSQKYITPGLMFVKLLQIFATVEFSKTEQRSSIENIIHQLQKKQEKGLSELDSRIVSIVLDNLTAAVTPVNSNLTIVTGTDAGNNIWYAAAIGTEVANLTYEQLLLRKDVKLTPQIQSSRLLIEEMRELYPDLTIKEFNQLLYRAEAINVTKGFMNTMKSLRETDLYIGIRSYQGGYTTKFTRSKASGITFSIKETIRESLTEKYNDGTLFKKINDFKNSKINGKPAHAVPQSGTPADKLEYIRRFYDTIAELQGINIGVSLASDMSGKLQDYVAQIEQLLNVASSIKVSDTHVTDQVLASDDEVIQDVENIKDDSFTSFINNIDGYLTRLSEFASLSSEFLRNPSVRTLTGDRYYKWHESSFAFDTLAYFVEAAPNQGIRGATGNNTNFQPGNFLLSSTYNRNPFVRGSIKNRIHNVGEWEGALNEDNKAVTPYLRENYNFFYQKKFIQGFLDSLKQFKNQYFQYVYVPSEKPKHPLVRIDLLTNEETNKAIREALEQILESQNWHINIDSYNKQKREDPFRNFDIGLEALRALKYTELTPSNIDEVAKMAVQILEQKSSEALKRLLLPEVELRLPINYHEIYRSEILQRSINPKYASTKVLSNDFGKFDLTKKDGYQNRIDSITEALIPTFELFFKNNYINGYFLNQLIAGEYAAYSSTENIVKRYAGVFAPGIRGLVDELVGMKENYKLLVLDDTHISKKSTENNLFQLMFGNVTREQVPQDQLAEFDRVMTFFEDKGYDMTDAQGFMLPSRLNDLGRGFERSWYRGAIHKPVHFEVRQVKVKDAQGNQLYNKDNHPITAAVPIYTKYSSVVLSDEMLGAVNSPILREFRRRLEYLGVDEVLFSSGVKAGAPSLLDEAGQALLVDEDNNPRRMTFKEFVTADETFLNKIKTLDSFSEDTGFKGSSSILTLSNRHFRLQHNPATNTDKAVAIYSQLMYFLNVVSNTNSTALGMPSDLKAEADRVYSLVAELIKIGRTDFEKQINTPTKLRKFLVEKFMDSPNGERVAEFIESQISFNNPLVEKKAIIAIASGMESSTVRVKFPGAKLVLQSAEGVRALGEELSDIDLKYTVDVINGKRVMVAEVLVPESLLTVEQKQAFKTGKSIYATGDGMGFRIPSTELHSAVPLKIVGTYSPAGKANVIVAPKELVPIHGSDFDVDSLFIIVRETYSHNDISVVTAENIINYQKNIKSILDVIKGLNTDNQYTTYLNEVKQRLGLSKEDITDFVSQDELYSRYEDWVSTPQFSAVYGKDIVRIDLDDFGINENQYKLEWAKLNGYSISGNKFEIANRLVASMSELKYFLETAPEEIKSKVQLDDVYPTLLGSPQSPIGYLKDSEGFYVINPDFLDQVKSYREELQKIIPTIHIDVKTLILPSINSSIKTLDSLYKKGVKNAITETMLSIITDIDRVGPRMLTPINFKVLKDAINNLGKDDSKKRIDLSNTESEYEVFYALSSGQKLVGSFANAVKDFAYLTQAGITSEEARNIYSAEQELINQLGDITSKLAVIELKNQVDWTPEELTLFEKLKESEKSLNKALGATKIKLRAALKKSKGSSNAQINSRYHYMIDGVNYNSLQFRKEGSQYNITEVFDTLINAAIDNLKLGLLGKANINTQTGAAVVGGVFLGTSLDDIVKILHQPILRAITTGISDRKESYIRSIIEENEELYNSLPAEITSAELKEGLSLSPNKSTWTSQQLSAQLRILKVFTKMDKIGQDAFTLSKFLSVIRDMQVTIENLDNLDNIISNKMGTIDEGGLFVPRADFSFISPNLLINTPHVHEAYKTHRKIQEIITSNFSLHSPEIRSLAQKISAGVQLNTDESIANSAENLADIRRSIAHYILANIIWPSVSSTQPETVTINKNSQSIKVTLSITRTFMQKVANNLKALQEFARKEAITNTFLDNVYIGRDRLNVPTINFRGGVNLHPEDHQQISLDFRKLNRFNIEDGKVTYATRVTPYSISQIQRDLINYAIIAYGLSYGSSNYSLYIPPSFLKGLDVRYNAELNGYRTEVRQKNFSRLDHLKLSYVAQNAHRLPYPDYTQIETTYKEGKERRRNGVDKPLTGETVYFDLKVAQSKSAAPEWLHEGSGTRMVVYRLVWKSAEAAYYQRVGKVKDLFYTPLSTEEAYNIHDYYKHDIYTLPYLYMDKNIIYSNTPVSHFLKEGDTVYIAPFYNFDRSERKLAKIVAMDKLTQSAKYSGWKYKIEIIEEVQTNLEPLEESEVDKVLKEKDKRCKSNHGSL